MPFLLLDVGQAVKHDIGGDIAQNVQPAECLHRPFDHLPTTARLAKIASQFDTSPPRVVDQSPGLFELGPAAPDKAKCRTFPREG